LQSISGTGVSPGPAQAKPAATKIARRPDISPGCQEVGGTGFQPVQKTLCFCYLFIFSNISLSCSGRAGKRAIVAIARTLLLRMRRMLLDERVYALPLAA
jgi:hypothetical protein